MTTINPSRVLHINQDSQVVVDEAGHPVADFVVLTDEHGGVHVLPRHLYDEIRQATGDLASAMKDRREHLRKVLNDMPERENQGDLSGLTNEVRSFNRIWRQLGRLF